MSLLRRKKNYFALSFSDNSLKLVQLDRQGKAVIALKAKITEGLIERGEIKDPRRVSELLGQVLKQKKIRLKYVSVSLPEVKAFTRVIKIPKLDLDELNQAVLWHVEPIMPGKPEDFYLDWKIISRTSQHYRLLVMALPKGLIDSYCQLLARCQLLPVAFEPTSLSLARLTAPSKTRHLVIEVEEKEAVLVLQNDRGAIELSSTLFYEPSEKTAEITALAKRILQYDRKISPKKKTSHVFLVGGSVSDDLSKSLVALDGFKVGKVVKTSPELTVITSVALKDIAAPVDELTINLLPPPIQGVYDREEKKRAAFNFLKINCLFLLLSLASFLFTIGKIHFETRQVENLIAAAREGFSPASKESAALAKDINVQSQKVVSLISAVDFASLLNLVNQAVPEGISLYHYSLNEASRELILDGDAVSRRQLLEFRQRLEKEPLFKSIRIPLSSLERETNVSFSIYFNYLLQE